MVVDAKTKAVKPPLSKQAASKQAAPNQSAEKQVQPDKSQRTPKRQPRKHGRRGVTIKKQQAILSILDNPKTIDFENKTIRLKRPAANEETRRAQRQLLEKSWLNSHWRKKWRARWGKNKWRSHLKAKWDGNLVWRRKWMKRLRENWWNHKWRRKWQELFLHEKWVRKYSRDRKKRRKFWVTKWKKSGNRRMGLSFNEFMITQRRLRPLKYVPLEVVNRRRRGKRLVKERRLEMRNIKPSSRFNKKVNKAWGDSMKIMKAKWKTGLQRHYGLKPAVIQYKLHILNMTQGLLTFMVLFYFYYMHGIYVPDAYALTGFLIMMLYPPVMDVFGSLFGAMTSPYLSSLYDPRKNKSRRKKKTGCCGCKWRKFGKKKPDKKQSVISKVSKGSRRSKRSRVSRRSKRALKGRMSTRKSRKSVLPLREALRADLRTTKLKEVEGKRQGCFCLTRLFGNCISRQRSLRLVNKMGCNSYLFLQLAWFLNLAITGYYFWMEQLSEEYREAVGKCGIFPRERHCYDFELLYFYVLVITGCSFLLRSLFLFLIGMCIGERFLKRSQKLNTKEEPPSTCSDTDIDFTQVPKQILVPYLLTDGAVFPYTLPNSSRPPQHLHKLRVRKTEANSKSKSGKQRRILSTREKERIKAIQGFSDIRRVTIPLRKGRRLPFKIPPVKATPDIVQLGPDLMSMEARAWLSEEDSDSSGRRKLRGTYRKVKHTYKPRKKRKRLQETHSLLVLHPIASGRNKSVADFIQPKLKHLSDRISTDESWSDHPSSLFQTDSHESEEEVEAVDRQKSNEDYLVLMDFAETDIMSAADRERDKDLSFL